MRTCLKVTFLLLFATFSIVAQTPQQGAQQPTTPPAQPCVNISPGWSVALSFPFSLPAGAAVVGQRVELFLFRRGDLPTPRTGVNDTAVLAFSSDSKLQGQLSYSGKAVLSSDLFYQMDDGDYVLPLSANVYTSYRTAAGDITEIGNALALPTAITSGCFTVAKQQAQQAPPTVPKPLQITLGTPTVVVSH